jgi:glycosyltransferase involved in cell wall biosynthesis
MLFLKNKFIIWMSMSNRKITLVISSLGGGGAERVCVTVANGLARLGWDVTLLVLTLENSAFGDQISNDVKIVNLNCNKARSAFFPFYRYVSKNLDRKYITFNYELTVLFVVLRKLFGFDVLLVARNINNFSRAVNSENNSIYSKVVSWLIMRFYSSADFYINQCTAMESDLVFNFPYLIGKSSVIYNPVSTIIENYSGREISGDCEKYLVCVGRLEKQKAFDLAIKSFSEFLKVKPDYKLKIVGDGSLLSELVQLSKDLGISDSVNFIGFESDVIPYYINAQATLLTSLYEGFPNVLVESITLGVPVVAIDCETGPSEIVVEGVNGSLVASRDITQCSAAMLNVVSSHYPNVAGTAKQFNSESVVSQYNALMDAL